MPYISLDDMTYLPDPLVASHLLPPNHRQQSNAQELEFCKTALTIAMEQGLEQADQDLLHRAFWLEQTQVEIAQALQMSTSTVSRRLQRAQEQLAHYVRFALEVHRNHYQHREPPS